jgi:hypothetical protein
MVLVIEKVSPSDFGKHQSLFIPSERKVSLKDLSAYDYNKQYLRNLCFDYKYGIIDSTTLDERLATFINAIPYPPLQPPPKMASTVNTRTILLQRINE